MPSSYDEMRRYQNFISSRYIDSNTVRVHTRGNYTPQYNYIDSNTDHTFLEPTDVGGELIEQGNTVRFISNERINLEIYKLEIGKEYIAKGVLANLILIEYNSELGDHSYFNSQNFLIVPDTPLEKKSIPKEKYDKLPNYMKECYDVMS